MRIKYMGTAHRAVLEAGHDFNGRLATGIPNRVVFDVDTNNHLIDTEEVGLTDEAAKLLLLDKDRFRDVTNEAVIPASLNEQTFKAMPGEEGSPESIPSPPEAEARTGASATAEASTGRARRPSTSTSEETTG